MIIRKTRLLLSRTAFTEQQDFYTLLINRFPAHHTLITFGMPAVTALIINRLIARTRSAYRNTHGNLLTINLQHRISTAFCSINVSHWQLNIAFALIDHLLYLITTLRKSQRA